MTQERKWLELFTEFVQRLRIASKEESGGDKRGSLFKLWGSQKRFLEELAQGLEEGVRFFIFLKSRQLGITTISLAIDIFWMAMYPGTLGALVVDNEGNREVFRQTIRRYIKSFPQGFFGASFDIVKGKDNSAFMVFNNGSRLDFLVAGKRENKTLGEGRGYAFVHCTEVSAYGSAEGLESFIQTLAQKNPNRLFLMESTAKGFNHFQERYVEAKRDVLTKRAVFIGWWALENNSFSKTGPGNEPLLFHTYGSAPPDPDERERIALVKEHYGVTITQGQLAWYRWKAASEDPQSLQQNQPWFESEAFVASGYSFFQIRSLSKIMETLTDPENIDRVYHGYRFLLSNNFFESKMDAVDTPQATELRMWEPPDPKGTYVIGCDPAGGRNELNDNHAFNVLRCYADKLVQVAEFAHNMEDTRQCAWILAYLAGAYRNCVMNIEVSGGYGMAVLNEFKSLRQQLMVTPPPIGERESEWADFTAQARWYLYRKYDSVAGTAAVNNFKTSRDTKIEIMSQLRDSLNTGLLHIRSVPLTEELMSVIVTDNGSIEAPGRNKDDRVFSLALANRAWLDQVRPGMVAMGATYAAVQAAQDGDDVDPGLGAFTNRLVQRFLERAAEKAESYDPTPQWMRDRNLV